MLKRSLALAVAVGLPVTAAQADTWQRYGSVRFDTDTDREVESLDFRGSIDRIRLTARRSGMVCRRVVAVFGNDRRRKIFSGRIRRGRSKTVDLPGNERRVDRLVLVCRATERGRERGRLLIEARTEGRRGRRHDWERLGAVRLDDRLDREVESTRNVGAMDRVRLTPRRSGVVCRRVVAVFGNGRRQEIFSGRIRRNSRKVIDLPGRERHVNRIIFTCRATRRGRHHARLLIDGRMEQRRRGRRARRGDATVCCRKLFFEWTTTARNCRRYEGHISPPRACR